MLSRANYAAVIIIASSWEPWSDQNTFELATDLIFFFR